MTESFPRQRARTRNFSTGVPRAFGVSPDGARVTFLRTKSGDDPVTCLWEADAATGAERLVADPRLLGADEENLPPEERARRERVRETGAGIVSYATDEARTLAVFALSGQVYATRLGPGGDAPRLMATRTPALDPRPDPSGTKIAYVHDGALRVLDLETGEDTAVAEPDGENITFGLAEFVAAEEMGRSRGYWWSPDGREILVARVDETPVNTWHIADPAHPDREPTRWKYPAAGTPNADVRLFLATLASGGGEGTGDGAGQRTGAGLAAVPWDTRAFPYLVTVSWGRDPLVVVQSRDQKTMRILHALTGETLHTDTDPHWTDIVSGVPAQLADGRVAWTAISDDTRRLVIAPAAELAAAAPLTPPGLQVKAVLGADGDTVYFTASREPTETGVWCYGPDGLAEVAVSPGVHTAVVAGGTTVVASRSLGNRGVTVTVNKTSVIESRALDPDLPMPAPTILQAGQDGIRTAVLFPSWHTPGTKLPVLMAPYGGPHHQEVVKSAAVYLQSQWFAEQGFAVVTADGHGTPSRGPAWDRAIAGDFATLVLEDQVTALHAAAAEFGDLDTSRVGIRGWSFGGYLSALAVLRRPDVFHAAVAGAPVTDWRLYDTHYTERYLGQPDDTGDSYQRSSLLDDPERIATSHSRGEGMGGSSPRSDTADQRHLLLIHGLADDNVLVAHSLRMSSALLAAGYPHSVLPLSGVTHMTPQEVVAENLLLLQVDFLRSALNMAITLCMCTTRRQPTARRRLAGLGGVVSNITSVQSSGQVRVAIVSVTGGQVAARYYQSAGSWYDPKRREATFLVAAAPGPGHGDATDQVSR
ncbi:MAG TPA: prolyl oligopeptidase family serine peptidase [Trebonia sp.]